MNKGPSITLDLLLVIGVLWIVIRGKGKSWIETIFHYNKVDLSLNPMPDLGAAIGGAIGNLNPFKPNPQPSRTNPDTGQVEIQAPDGTWLPVPGAGGNPQIAPGVG